MDGLPDDLIQIGWRLPQVIKLRDATREILKPLHCGPSSESLIRTVEPIGKQRKYASTTAISHPSEGTLWVWAETMLGHGVVWKVREGFANFAMGQEGD